MITPYLISFCVFLAIFLIYRWYANLRNIRDCKTLILMFNFRVYRFQNMAEEVYTSENPFFVKKTCKVLFESAALNAKYIIEHLSVRGKAAKREIFCSAMRIYELYFIQLLREINKKHVGSMRTEDALELMGVTQSLLDKKIETIINPTIDSVIKEFEKQICR